MAEDAYWCALDGADGARLGVRLYRRVGAGARARLRQRVVSGEWRCTALKARLVLAPLQLAVAANRAAVAHARGALVTRSVYSELLYNLSLSKNISQSLSKFGVEDDEDIVVCYLSTEEEGANDEVHRELAQGGEPRPLDELAEVADLPAIKAAYKIDQLKLDSHNRLLDIIVSRIVTKNFVSH